MPEGPATSPELRKSRKVKVAPPRQIDPKLKARFEQLDVPQQDWFEPSGRIIAFAHMLVVPAGKFVGKPLRLRKFQMEFIRDVYNPRFADGRRRRRQAILSIGRRGGKTLLAALLILVHLVGPAKRPNSTLVSAATTRKQAGIVYRMAAQMVRQNLVLSHHLRILDSSKSIVHKGDGSHYQAISAEAGSAFGEGLDFVVFDEMAQTKTRALYDALMTSLGSQIEPLMMVISTQAPTDDHLLSELIDYGQKIAEGEIEDDSFTVHLYAAKADCDLLDEQEWVNANPTLGDYRDLSEFRMTMSRAVKVPSLEASVRNLYLNQRVQSRSPFLTTNVWALGKDLTPDPALLADPNRKVYGGLDLSARLDLSSLVLAVMDDHSRVHLFPRVWTPGDTLAARGVRDRAPYSAWAQQGALLPVPGDALDYDFLAKDVGDLTKTIGITEIAYDRWRLDVFKQALARMGVLVPLKAFGQGYKDMSPALETFEQLAIEGRIVHGNHPVLRWCVSNAVLDIDAAGNRKLNKSRSTGRIDVAIAALMAVGAMMLQTEPSIDISAIVG